MSTEDQDWDDEGLQLNPSLALVDYLIAYRQDLMRRLDTGLGRLWYDPTFGIYTNGIRDILNESGISTGQVNRDIATCIRHDRRTAEVRVDVDNPTGNRWTIAIRAKHRDGGSVVIPLVVE